MTLFALGIIVGAIATWFVARNNKKKFYNSFDVDELLRTQGEKGISKISDALDKAKETINK